MFAKLLKHELRASGRTLIPMSLIVLSSSALGFFLTLIASLNRSIEDSALFSMIALPIYTIVYISLFAYLIASIFIPYSQFYKHKFSDQGYLTFTLPVTSHQILITSILNLIISTITAIAVVLVSLLMMNATNMDTVESILNILEILTVDYDVASVLYSISGTLYSMMLPYLAITLGSTFAQKRKVGLSLLFGYGISIVVNIVTTIIASVISILTYDQSNPFRYSSTLYITYIIMYTVIAVGSYFLTHYIINKKLNL